LPYLIGTDEAGYGPNLGPLTIAGTLWETESTETDLYHALSDAVANQSTRSAKSQKVFIADSKKVYSGSIEQLETNVLAVVYALSGKIPADWQELIELLCPQHSETHSQRQLWLDEQKKNLPLAADLDNVKILGDLFQQSCTRADVRLLGIECHPIFPPQFNEELILLGNKATLLSTYTLKIVHRLMTHCDDDTEIGCDKHGGRSKYAGLVQAILAEELVLVGNETREISDYSFRKDDHDVFIRFQAKGESFLPTALASMVAKYLREVFMAIWNQYWIKHLPEIKPTKGYPVDAKRFKSEIAELQSRLGLSDHLVWRNK
jgi:ribonuclease HII